ncbi:hypothetical protein CFE53_05680 [Methanofervidicoccus sp. A16]|uniref:DUF1894 domain-containing protein n=1 Tax=Methanofervidicoccus sp. A16 TaxID=2607662 RepID=UPI0011880636|nr:DUF1894 domain-containing protein [Methanofervidicoccus sp. A16]AXI25640.1 hypothetical protein CFE53_05680 [Methanofervidicoccus sp. A16]MBW9220143.1 DUF1894 domain-containing protein [Methanothermococcus sp. SCGC AD-155-N22]
MSCIEKYDYEILFKGSFKKCSDYIKKNFKNIRYLKAGEEVLKGVLLIGKPPIPVAYEEDFVIFPYTKPCHGTFVLKVPLSESSSEKKDNKDKKGGFLSILKFW